MTMERLIDADKVNPSDVFVGISDFAADCRNAVVKLLAAQPTSTPSMRRADVIAGNAEACTKALIRLTVMYRTGVAIRMGFKATCFHIFIAFMDLRGRRNSRNRQRRQRKTITCIVMSLQSQEGRLAYIASRANVGFRTRQTQRCARKGYMLIVIGARTDYVICATERSRRPHHDDAYRRGCHPLDVPSRNRQRRRQNDE